ncbi:MAG: hydroxyphenylacetyl-CoA thioesterase PaaI [Aestuariivita sp.]|nr:hydroxyphenylacetyl-CoA thioesterase PaaI [Aestuariivita sp.]
MSPQERAEHCAEIMWKNDTASKWLGMKLDTVGPGTATLSFQVDNHHLNGHHICHGGYIFALADSAFAFACNSYNQRAVAQHNQISFLLSCHKGEKVIAHAIEKTKMGRTGIYDVQVVNSNGSDVALFRGISRIIKGQHFEEAS